MSKRIQVTFTNEQWGIIKKFRGILGESDAELIRNIVLIWLSEKSVITTKIKKDRDDDENENGNSS